MFSVLVIRLSISISLTLSCIIFFFQAEDGIRDTSVTGVQTCALPIFAPKKLFARGDNLANSFLGAIDEVAVFNRALSAGEIRAIYNAGSAGKCEVTTAPRSEERRVGKEGRDRRVTQA